MTSDTIYISGGSYGGTKIYPQDVLTNIRPSHQVVITKGKDIGHNGVVLFYSVNSTPYRLLSITGCSNLKITNLKFYWNLPAPTYNEAIAITKGSSHIQIDSCAVRSNGKMDCILVNACSHISITNDSLLTDRNNSSNDQDALWIGSGGGGHLISGNVIMTNGYNTSPHIDGIQLYQEGGTGLPITISDNFIYKAGQCIYISGIYSSRVFIYNNILVDTCSGYNTGGQTIITVQASLLILQF